MAEKKQSKKETKSVLSDDVDKFFRDMWGKVVEYASLGADEATKVSATAKTRVDVETLKFKRGKLLKMLGEQYWDLVEKDPTLTVAGTGEIIRQIKALDKEVAGLEKEVARKAEKAEKAAAMKKAAPKPQAKKTAAAKKPAAKKPAAKKPAAKKPAAKKPAAKKPAARKPAAKKPAAKKPAAKKPAPPKTDTATGVGSEE